MGLLSGQIDHARLARDAQLPTPALQSDVYRLTAPGVDLAWDARRVDHAMHNGVLALLAGRSREPSGGNRMSASAWIERYKRLGDRLASEVSGGFALVLLDMDSGTTHLVVDRFSIETLCFRRTPSGVAFSDRACDVPASEKSVSPQALYDYLYYHVIPAPQTIFRDVRRLEAAEHMVIGRDECRVRKWWVPKFIENDRSNLNGRMQQFRDLVATSVTADARDTNAACFLSGGTDSSTVAGMLAREQDKSVDCYSIGFDSQGYDEMEYSRLAARHFGLRHHEYYVTPKDLRESIPTIAASFDQPFGNSSVLPAYYCALQARKDGHEHMLAGDGGDELFGGNSRYATQTLFEIYQKFPLGLRRALLEPLAHRTRLFRRAPLLKQIGGYIRHSSVPMPERLETFNLLHQFGENYLLTPEFSQHVDRHSPLHQQRANYNAIACDTLLNRMLAYDWKYTLADSDLPKVRGATQLAGVTVGYPLMSSELTDFSLALPADWKLRHFKLRWFFKKALADFLPAEILKKKKHGFGLPFGPWVLSDSGLRELVEAALVGTSRRGMLNDAASRELMTKYLPVAPGYYGEIIWLFVMAEYWFRAHTPDIRF